MANHFNFRNKLRSFSQGIIEFLWIVKSIIFETFYVFKAIKNAITAEEIIKGELWFYRSFFFTMVLSKYVPELTGWSFGPFYDVMTVLLYLFIAYTTVRVLMVAQKKVLQEKAEKDKQLLLQKKEEEKKNKVSIHLKIQTHDFVNEIGSNMHLGCVYISVLALMSYRNLV